MLPEESDLPFARNKNNEMTLRFHTNAITDPVFHKMVQSRRSREKASEVPANVPLRREQLRCRAMHANVQGPSDL